MLYIFDPEENLIALLKPDFTRSTGPAPTSRAFLSAAFPAEFDREPTAGCSYWDAVHREVLNGENTFTFTVPADQVDAAYVQDGNLVAFKDLDSYWQFFEIKRLVDLHGDGLTRTAYCEHIFYELLDDIVTDKRPSGSATAALSGMLEGTRWQVGIVDDLGASSTSAYYESVLSGVQKVANAWQGELNWRCVISGGVITRYVDLRAMVGTDTGKQFAYSKDILSIEREEDISGIATALYGRGKGIELDSGAYGRRLTFADVVAPDKPAGQEWIGDSDALAQWGRPGGRHRFDVFTDEEETDPEKLLEKTRAELARRKVPRVTYRLDVVSLEQLTGYEHEQVRLGDLVRVIDREFKPELVVSARVVDIERDLLAPENTKVVLGSFAPTIVDATINTRRRVEEMANKPYNTRWLDGVIDVLQNAIENRQAYIWETPQGTLHMNAPSYEQATEAMLLGGGRFAIANQKDGQGGWNWRTFGDGSGFTADLITAGTIDAGLVQIGHATTFEEGYDPVDNHLYFQYSVDGTSWHDVFNSATDKYMRQKVGDNGTWTDPARIVGEDGYTPVKGTDYFDGEPGQNGVSSYLWVRYSQNANGNPMTTDPTNAKYIGVATTITSSAPTSYTSYSWSLIKGQDGIPGETGASGQTSYLHIKYSDDGATFTANNGETPGAYIGTYVDFTQADSTNFSTYTWNKIKGADGKDVRKFTTQPVPPYGVGDLWIKSDGNTFVCILARETGVYTASDWRDVAKNKFNAPGYAISTPEGIKVFDNNSVLRVLLGSWLKDAIRKYGIKIIDGEIYSSLISTGEEGDNRGTLKIIFHENPDYPQVNWGEIEFYGGLGYKIMGISSSAGQPSLRFYDEDYIQANPGQSQYPAGFIALGTGSATKEMYFWSSLGGIGLSCASGESISMGATGGQNNSGVAISRFRADLLPLYEHYASVGNNTYPWWQVRAYMVTSGDLSWDERSCAICGEQFADGDILNLMVKTVDDTYGTLTIPVHERCKDTPAVLEVLVPEMATKYRLNYKGEIETYFDAAYEETEEEVVVLHPDYEFDESTGRFKRKLTENNIKLFEIKAIEAGVKASKRAALATDTIIRKKPKMKTIQIQVGKPSE